MVRRKIQMKKIENTTNRQATFFKRRNGLLKKAYELSVLCDVQVAVIIFSQKGRLYQFSSSDMKTIIERYFRCNRDAQATRIDEEEYLQKLKFDTASMAEKIETLQHSKRMLMGYGLSSCTNDELQALENQLKTSLHSIRLRKSQLYVEHLQQQEAKERNIEEESASLSEMKLKFDTASMAEKIEILQHSKRSPHCSSTNLVCPACPLPMLMGYGFSSCTNDELQALENQLKTGVHSIRLRKSQLYVEHLQQQKAKERNMEEENASLSEMCGENPWQRWGKHNEAAPVQCSSPSGHTSDVETELFIGLPHQRC